jgi:AcrR family transcriptional regulator
VIDVERSRVVEILPGCDGEALKEWLNSNPQVEVITRDRWAAYAQANEAAPQAKQVADRWHLREVVERVLARFSSEIRAATETSNKEASESPTSTTQGDASSSTVEDEPGSEIASTPTSNPSEPSAPNYAKTAKRREREDRHRLVRQLREQGLSLRQIARQVGCSIKAVRRYLRNEKCPDWKPDRCAPTLLDEFARFVGDWIARGGRNSADLFRLLKAKGCRASYDAVRRYLRRKLGSTGRPGPRGSAAIPAAKRPAPPRPTSRSLSFAFINGHEATDAAKVLKAPRERVPDLNEALTRANELAGMFR